MESWKVVLHKGFLPQWSDAQLRRLKEKLETDSPQLTQGSTTTPPPLMCVAEWPMEACCPVCWGALPADCDLEKVTVGETEQAFAKACYEADLLMGEPAACRWLLNWIDDTPRPQMLKELLTEIETELALRMVLRKNEELYSRLAKGDGQ